MILQFNGCNGIHYKKTQVPRPWQIISRCENFWFEDGTVILQSGMVQSRVHESFLSKQSDVFKSNVSGHWRVLR